MVTSQWPLTVLLSSFQQFKVYKLKTQPPFQFTTNYSSTQFFSLIALILTASLQLHCTLYNTPIQNCFVDWTAVLQDLEMQCWQFSHFDDASFAKMSFIIAAPTVHHHLGNDVKNCGTMAWVQLDVKTLGQPQELHQHCWLGQAWGSAGFWGALLLGRVADSLNEVQANSKHQEHSGHLQSPLPLSEHCIATLT